jgi:protein ImuB
VGETLAQVAALVGAERVGIPIPLDTHRPDALRLTPFRCDGSPSAPPRPRGKPAGGDGSLPGDPESRDGLGPRTHVGRDVCEPARPAAAAGEDGPPLGLRRLRPARPAAVTLVGGRPVHLRAGPLAGPIVNGAGPWRSSGEWWVNPWVHDEWDVELADGTLCRLAHDGSTWFLEGLYG